jgi:alkylation response protein AidB-like acyl-CoA dehydrogenase
MNTQTQTVAQEFTEELQAMSDLAKNFASKELVANREENDHYPFGELFTETIKNANDVGFYSVNLPAEHGGIGMGNSALASILEELSMADASMAAIVFTNAAAIEIINQASLDTDCKAVYKMLSANEVLPVAFSSFTGLGEMEMPVADKNGKISGRINFLSLGGISKYAVVPAADSGHGNKISYYLLDLSEQGIEKSEPVYSLGLHTCPGIDIFLENVPAKLIGVAGEGEKYFHAMQSRLSPGAAAVSLGIMKGSFMEALQYTKDRFQGGRQIINWSEVRMILANMAVEIQAGQSALASACGKLDAEVAGWEKTARAVAIHIAEMACRATVDGVQLLGGNGYMKDYGQEKRMRDAGQAQCLLGMAPVRKMDLIDMIIKESE